MEKDCVRKRDVETCKNPKPVIASLILSLLFVRFSLLDFFNLLNRY